MKYQKTTDELHKKIKESKNIHAYLSDNHEELNENTGELPAALQQLLSEKKMSVSDVTDNTNISVPYAYAVLNGKKKPARDMLLRILLGLSCTREEIDRMLKLAGYKELYPRNKQDACIIFILEKHLNKEEMYDLLQSEGISLLEES